MVNRADINSVLMQMRQVRQQIQPSDTSASGTAPIGQGLGAQGLGTQGNGVNPAQNTFASQLQQQREQMTSSGISNTSVQKEMTQQDFINQAAALNTRSQPQMELTPPSSAPTIGEMMGNAINQVNETQMHSSELSTRYTQGDPNIDLPEVMVAMQKSSVSFQAMSQVRNKLLEAYKDIMNMPV